MTHPSSGSEAMALMRNLIKKHLRNGDFKRLNESPKAALTSVELKEIEGKLLPKLQKIRAWKDTDFKLHLTTSPENTEIFDLLVAMLDERRIVSLALNSSVAEFDNFQMLMARARYIEALDLSGVIIWEEMENLSVANSARVFALIGAMLQVNQTLLSLNLSWMELDDIDAIELAKGLLGNNTLVELNLRHNKIRTEGIEHLFDAILGGSTSLAFLDLSGNNAFDLGIKENSKKISRLFSTNTTLTNLSLLTRSCDPSYKPLCAALAKNQHLQNLVLSHHLIFADEDSVSVGEMLKQNKTLRHFSLHCAPLDKNVVKQNILEAIPLNKSLQSFTCPYLFNDSEKAQIEEVLALNIKKEERRLHEWRRISPMMSFFRANRGTSIICSIFPVIQHGIMPLINPNRS